MLAKKLQAAALSTQPSYIEDVFSTYLYTGNSSSQTITNGIDLAGKGGLVWAKSRTGPGTSSDNHFLIDTVRGASSILSSNTTAAALSSSNYLYSFNSNGMTLMPSTSQSDRTYVSWTFRKQEKFFDVVTYTGTGANRTVAHNLGSVPGCIIVKRTDTTGDWQVYHRANTANPETDYLVLNSTAATADSNTRWNDTLPTSTVFSLGTDATVNANGGTYVAYLFAHDAGGFGESGTDNVISCGSFNDTDNAVIDLGYEPQFLLLKRASGGTSIWIVIDNMRGWQANGGTAQLYPNQDWTELSDFGDDRIRLTSTGFLNSGGMFGNTGSTIIYIAIRRGPMKTPTDATKVFQPTVYTGTNVDNRLVDTTIAPDMVFVRQRNDTVLGGMVVGDRLRGQPYMLTGSTAAEVNDADAFDTQAVSGTELGTAFSSMSGFYCGNDPTAKLNANTTSNNHVVEAFKRAPGFFDVVCYTGTGADTTFSHNLGVAPELMITKQRTATPFATDWFVSALYGVSSFVLVGYLNLNSAGGSVAYQSILRSRPTSTGWTIGNNATVNNSGSTYIAYLFATVAGVSKVGSYTGSGTTKQIDCGFTGGARFVLIKATSTTGDWLVWDSARGIVAGNDPYLALNSTAAEVTTTDWVDTYSAGFELSNASGNLANTNGTSYIFLAVS